MFCTTEIQAQCYGASMGEMVFMKSRNANKLWILLGFGVNHTARELGKTHWGSIHVPALPKSIVSQSHARLK